MKKGHTLLINIIQSGRIPVDSRWIIGQSGKSIAHTHGPGAETEINRLRVRPAPARPGPAG